ncbi:MAG: hypothetical protein FJ119_01320 [Deltaproteobacteria bacterium]|nr:hypothetical protein [Deltaproteobacteria bacterium]
MRTSTYVKEEKLISDAVNTLLNRFGAVETNRFLALMKSRDIDSVKRHRAWQSKLAKDAFFDAVFK